MSGNEVGGDGCERVRQRLDVAIGNLFSQSFEDFARAHEPTAKPHVDIRRHLPAIEPAHPALESVERVGRVGRTDDGTDRRAADDLGTNAFLGKTAQHADVRPATSGAATERQADGPFEPARGGRRARHEW